MLYLWGDKENILNFKKICKHNSMINYCKWWWDQICGWKSNRNTVNRNRKIIFLHTQKSFSILFSMYIGAFNIFQVYQYFTIYRQYFFSYRGKRFLTRQIPTSCLPKSGGYHKWALAHSSSCCTWYRPLLKGLGTYVQA